MSALPGSLASKSKSTFRVLYKRTGDIGSVELGNIVKGSFKPTIQRVSHMASLTGDSGGGVKAVDGKLVTTTENLWEFTLSEHSKDNLRLLLLGEELGAANQASNATLAVAITDVKPGRSYWVGAYNITSAALTFATLTKTEGTDYLLDKASGILTILAAGSIADGDDVAGSVAVPAQKYNQATMLKTLRAPGSFEIFEFDQLGVAPRRHWTIANGEIYTTNWGEQSAEAFNEVTVEVLAISRPVCKERADE